MTHFQQVRLIRDFYESYAQIMESRWISPKHWATITAMRELPHLSPEQQEMCDRVFHMLEKGRIQCA